MLAFASRNKTSVVPMTLRFLLIYCKCIIGGFTCGYTGEKYG